MIVIYLLFIHLLYSITGWHPSIVGNIVFTYTKRIKPKCWILERVQTNYSPCIILGPTDIITGVFWAIVHTVRIITLIMINIRLTIYIIMDLFSLPLIYQIIRY